MEKLKNYVEGQWIEGCGTGVELSSAYDGTPIALSDTDGLNWGNIFEYGRKKGASLRAMTFHERGRCLKALALHLLEKKEIFYQISYQTGATRKDSWIDIEGGIGNLFVMSSKGRREMPDTPWYMDGKVEGLSRQGSFVGQHLCVPKEGVALHINAFNFPVWGMLEKIAVNLLAGVPCIVKPATVTCYLTHAVVQEIIASNILPEGSLQLICGSARNILDCVCEQDVVTFTGSAETGKTLKNHPNITQYSVPFNLEADSLNCCILGPDAYPETVEFDLFIKEIAREMTVKAGQKCTAVRRIIVPNGLAEAVQTGLVKRLEGILVGDPREEQTRMGPLVSQSQVGEVQERVEQLKEFCQVVYDEKEHGDLFPKNSQGSFYAPTLLTCANPIHHNDIHAIEAFGPVATIMPYQHTDDAITLAQMGKGSLVGSVVTADNNFARDIVLGSACYHGRFLVLNKDCAKESTGHGSPMPQLIHGGPGRAGGGEEMGGVRGLSLYMQRTALQGHPSTLTAIGGIYTTGSVPKKPPTHPFRLFFEELEIGHTLETAERVISKQDIDAFAELSGDHFYAHKSDSDFSNTLFESQVAHGYFVLAAAAGLFVDAAKGPVLANYGIDEFRFTKPLYVGAKINVKLTVKEKIAQENREGEIPRGIVKWQVEVIDSDNETAASGTILTLVAKK